MSVRNTKSLHSEPTLYRVYVLGIHSCSVTTNTTAGPVFTRAKAIAAARDSVHGHAWLFLWSIGRVQAAVLLVGGRTSTRIQGRASHHLFLPLRLVNPLSVFMLIVVCSSQWSTVTQHCGWKGREARVGWRSVEWCTGPWPTRCAFHQACGFFLLLVESSLKYAAGRPPLLEALSLGADAHPSIIETLAEVR